jgi:cell division protein FtsL
MKKVYRNIIIAIFLIYFVITLISQQKTLNQYKAETESYSKQLETAKKTNEELQETKSNVDSTDYIEEIAREKLDMYLPNERVYIDISK